MVTIIGVRFRVAGKIYYFDPGALQIGRNGKVIVETARGQLPCTLLLCCIHHTEVLPPALLFLPADVHIQKV